jgi:hypothetical protein
MKLLFGVLLTLFTILLGVRGGPLVSTTVHGFETIGCPSLLSFVCGTYKFVLAGELAVLPCTRKTSGAYVGIYIKDDDGYAISNSTRVLKYFGPSNIWQFSQVYDALLNRDNAYAFAIDDGLPAWDIDVSTWF